MESGTIEQTLPGLETMTPQTELQVGRALALQPQNAQIRQNYDLFKEINDRTDGAKETP